MRKVLIGVPCMDMCSSQFAQALFNLDCEKNSIFVSNSLVYIAREAIAEYAEKNGYEYVLFIDSDMSFPKDALKRLMLDCKDIVSASYIGRKEPYNRIAWKSITKEPGGFKMEVDEGEDLHRVSAVGLGFCLVKTEIFKKIRDTYGCIFDPADGMGEDIAFCTRARQCGYKVYIDPRVKCSHWGMTEFKEE